MSHIMRKPVYAICEQQGRRSACASAQSDQHLCCSLPTQYNTSSYYIWNLKPLPSFCGCAGWFESTLVANSEDRFSRDVACIKPVQIQCVSHMSPVKRICVFEHSVMTNFNCACPAIQRGQGSGFMSAGSSWLTAYMSKQQRFWRDCADAQARLNFRCSHRR